MNPNSSRYFLRSVRIILDLLSYESKPADIREQYNWRAVIKLDGMDLLNGLYQYYLIHSKPNSLFMALEIQRCLQLNIFFLWSSQNRVDLLLLESKMTNKRGQYNWRAEKKLDGNDPLDMLFQNSDRLMRCGHQPYIPLVWQQYSGNICTVCHSSVNRAQRCSTSVIVRELIFTSW